VYSLSILHSTISEICPAEGRFYVAGPPRQRVPPCARSGVAPWCLSATAQAASAVQGYRAGKMPTLYPAPSRALIRRRRCAASVWDFTMMSCLLCDVRNHAHNQVTPVHGECTSELAACMFAR
jgi:hypothetical protein